MAISNAVQEMVTIIKISFQSHPLVGNHHLQAWLALHAVLLPLHPQELTDHRGLLYRLLPLSPLRLTATTNLDKAHQATASLTTVVEAVAIIAETRTEDSVMTIIEAIEDTINTRHLPRSRCESAHFQSSKKELKKMLHNIVTA